MRLALVKPTTERAEGECEMADHENRREMPAWLNPSFVLSLLVQLVMVVAIIVSGRADAANTREKVAELKGQVTTLQSLVQVTTEQKGDIKALTERMAKAESAIETQTKAYNFNFTTRLANAEAKLGIPSAK